ncbi:exopolysaccharide export protein VpsN [soil metagenome]
MKSILSLFAIVLALAPASARADENYAIRASDLLQISVFQEPDLSLQVRVSEDGSIRLPLIGDLPVGGMSTGQAAASIRARYLDGYLVNPQVSVTVLSFAKRRFTVLGQVQRPGAYIMPDTGEVSVLQAIGLAGGFTRLANTKKVILKRTASGREKIIEINAKEIAKSGGREDVRMIPGDILTVNESLF